MNVRKPTRGPSPLDVADRDRWERLAGSSLTSTRTAAEKWRTGLAAFVTLVTGVLFLKGPESASSVSDGWLVALTVLTAAGLAFAVRGLWLSLDAAAGAPANVTYSEITRTYGGVQQFEIVSARASAAKLDLAKAWVARSLVLFGLASFTWWWAPTAPTDPSTEVTVALDAREICGSLESADNGQLRVEVAGESRPRVIDVSEMVNLSVGPCDDD